MLTLASTPPPYSTISKKEKYNHSRQLPTKDPADFFQLRFSGRAEALTDHPPVRYTYYGLYRGGIDDCVAFTFRNLLELRDDRGNLNIKEANPYAEDASRALYFMLTLVDCIHDGTAQRHIDLDLLRRFEETVPADDSFHSFSSRLRNGQPVTRELFRTSNERNTDKEKISLNRNAFMLFLSQITDAECVDLYTPTAREKVLIAFKENKPILISESAESDKQHHYFEPFYAHGGMISHGRRHLSLVYPLEDRLYLSDPNLHEIRKTDPSAITRSNVRSLSEEERPNRQAFIIHRWYEIPGWLRSETDKRWPPVNQFAKDLFSKVSS